MRKSFYPALGTPLDPQGNVIAGSLAKHVEDQVDKGAEALLVMGSMGIQPMVKEGEYAKVSRIAAEAARGACPVLVGVMDNSIARVKDRIDALSNIQISGVVSTVPFYYPSSQEEMKTFFRTIADYSPFPVYLYDHPSVTQCKIQASTVLELVSHPNIAGIKSADLALCRVLFRDAAGRNATAINPEFEIIYSGLDTFDIASEYGIARNLDGMFSCASSITSTMYAALNEGNRELAADCLDKIVGLRNLFVEVGVFPGFTCAMNALGFEGSFQPDYSPMLDPVQADKVKTYMRQIQLI